LKLLQLTFFLAAVILLQHNYVSGQETPGAESDCASLISIYGSSNVNQFQLINYNLRIVRHSGDVVDKKRYQRIEVPVNEFKGDNSRMLKDFLEMINASEHPLINLAIEPRDLGRCMREKGVHNFNTTITIAAVSNSYIVPCKLDSCENSGYVLRGKLNVKLTDFGIDPPHKFFGIVKVNDDILIDYVFRFQSDDDIFR
jgi:hypothetical protein